MPTENVLVGGLVPPSFACPLALSVVWVGGGRASSSLTPLICALTLPALILPVLILALLSDALIRDDLNVRMILGELIFGIQDVLIYGRTAFQFC